MSKIYLDKKTMNALYDKILYKSIDEGIDNPCYITFKKKYTKIYDVIMTTNILVHKIKKIICDYIDDIITLRCTITDQYNIGDEGDTDTKNSDMLESNKEICITIYFSAENTYINFRKYRFAFSIDMCIYVDTYYYSLCYYAHYRNNNVLEFSDYNDEIEDSVSEYIRNINIIHLFNVYMYEKYNKSNYIDILEHKDVYEKKYVYNNNSIQYTDYDNKNHDIRIPNHKILKNVIIIMKCVIEQLQIYFDVIPPENILYNYNKKN